MVRGAVGHLHRAGLVGVYHVSGTVGCEIYDDPVKGYELGNLSGKPLVNLVYRQRRSDNAGDVGKGLLFTRTASLLRHARPERALGAVAVGDVIAVDVTNAVFLHPNDDEMEPPVPDFNFEVEVTVVGDGLLDIQTTERRKNAYEG